MARTGRPSINIDKEQFEKLCGFLCTLTEIAGWFDCSEDTIERWCLKTYEMTFAETLKRKSQKAKISLRRSQLKMAEKNATMAIWLGKQYLGQRDVVENQIGLVQEDDALSASLKQLGESLTSDKDD